MTDLLPPNATPLEQRIADVCADIERADVPMDALWDGERIPANMLPWLGWAVGVDHWDRRWSDDVKRQAVAEAIPIRRLRGTVWAVRRALETLGYTDVEILEHAQQDAAWRDAGGLYLDGSIVLDAAEMLGGDLVDAPRVVTTSWAQYALAFNIADAPFEARDQRRIRERVESAAPLRSELIALIYRYATAWSAQIRVALLRQSVRMSYSDCGGARVHRARPLMGCWSLSGEYAARNLDGAERLRGRFLLTGQRPIGEALDQGWGSAALSVRQATTLGFRSATNDTWTLGESRVDAVDGSWALNECVDGHRRIDGSWTLELAQLHRIQRPLLNGIRALGRRDTLSTIGTTGRAVVRDRRLRKEIYL
jgi:phage tail P2-like protein